ncbi:MAG: iron-sulfur cluster assembly accessory protein [Clostridia bacterium]|nr:iron-sulfur cluster assembly accessory protein [Clostridia bacterium]
MALRFTPEAAGELRRLLEEEGDPKPDLRILVQHRCECGNVHFGMGWDARREDDVVLEEEGFRVVFDRDTEPYLEEAEVDFESRGDRQGFVIRRPGAGGCCGG